MNFNKQIEQEVIREIEEQIKSDLLKEGWLDKVKAYSSAIASGAKGLVTKGASAKEEWDKGKLQSILSSYAKKLRSSQQSILKQINQHKGESKSQQKKFITTIKQDLKKDLTDLFGSKASSDIIKSNLDGLVSITDSIDETINSAYSQLEKTVNQQFDFAIANYTKIYFNLVGNKKYNDGEQLQKVTTEVPKESDKQQAISTKPEPATKQQQQQQQQQQSKDKLKKYEYYTDEQNSDSEDEYDNYTNMSVKNSDLFNGDDESDEVDISKDIKKQVPEQEEVIEVEQKELTFDEILSDKKNLIENLSTYYSDKKEINVQELVMIASEYDDKFSDIIAECLNYGFISLETPVIFSSGEKQPLLLMLIDHINLFNDKSFKTVIGMLNSNSTDIAEIIDSNGDNIYHYLFNQPYDKLSIKNIKYISRQIEVGFGKKECAKLLLSKNKKGYTPLNYIYLGDKSNKTNMDEKLDISEEVLPDMDVRDLVFSTPGGKIKEEQPKNEDDVGVSVSEEADYDEEIQDQDGKESEKTRETSKKTQKNITKVNKNKQKDPKQKKQPSKSAQKSKK